jgi:hypothetical protein
MKPEGVSADRGNSIDLATLDGFAGIVFEDEAVAALSK